MEQAKICERNKACWFYREENDEFVYGPWLRISEDQILILRERTANLDGEIEDNDSDYKPYDVCFYFSDEFPYQASCGADCETLYQLAQRIKAINESKEKEKESKLKELKFIFKETYEKMKKLDEDAIPDIIAETVEEGWMQRDIAVKLEKPWGYENDKDMADALRMYEDGVFLLPCRDDNNAADLIIPLSKVQWAEEFNRGENSYYEFKVEGLEKPLEYIEPNKYIERQFKAFKKLAELKLIK